jgi:hypothetical protein
MNKVNHTAMVLKFARDALTDARCANDTPPQKLAELQAAHDTAAQAHGHAFSEHMRNVAVRR